MIWTGRFGRSVVGLLRGGLYAISCLYNLEGLEYIARRQIENRSEMPFLCRVQYTHTCTRRVCVTKYIVAVAVVVGTDRTRHDTMVLI